MQNFVTQNPGRASEWIGESRPHVFTRYGTFSTTVANNSDR